MDGWLGDPRLRSGGLGGSQVPGLARRGAAARGAALERGDKYTRESRTEANRHLMHANLPSLSPFQCTEHINKAKKALREGKN